MLKKVEVKNSGDSNYLPGEIVDRIKFENTNEKLKSDGKTFANWRKSINGYYKSIITN